MGKTKCVCIFIRTAHFDIQIDYGSYVNNKILKNKIVSSSISDLKTFLASLKHTFSCSDAQNYHFS